MAGHYLFTKDDVELMDKYIDELTKKAKKKKMVLIEPYEDEIKKVSSIILKYVRENKRKIYGGYALNLLIKEKSPDDAIYSEEDIPDIDFYSPDPLNDLVKICNLLYQSGFKPVRGSEALHKETYSIRVNTQLYCDIYMFRGIFITECRSRKLMDFML